MISNPRFLVAVATILVAAAPLSARPMRMPGSENLGQIIKDSDLVIRGIVTHVEEKSGAPAPTGLTVDVQRAYKGNSKDKLDVTIESASSLCPVPREGNGVLVLAKVKDGKAVVTDCSLGVWSAGKTLKKGGGAPSLEDDLLNDLNDTDRKVVAGALKQLGNLRTRRGHEALRQFLSSDAPDIRALAVSGLLKDGDYSGLGLVDGLKEKKIGEWLIMAQIDGQISAIRDKAALPALIELTRSKHDDVVKSAAYALREIKSPTSAARLVELLDHSNPNVRYDAVAGLDAIEHGEKAETPSVASFEKNSDKYVVRWKDWWTKTGKKKYQK